MDVIICKPLVVYRFYCMALIHSQTQRHMINVIIYAHFNPVQIAFCLYCFIADVVKYITNIYFGSKNSFDVFINACCFFWLRWDSLILYIVMIFIK